MTEQLFDNILLENVTRSIAERGKQRIYKVFSWVMAGIGLFLGLVFISGIVLFSYLYGLYLCDNTQVSLTTINLIERIAIYFFGIISGFIAKLAYKAMDMQ